MHQNIDISSFYVNNVLNLELFLLAMSGVLITTLLCLKIFEKSRRKVGNSKVFSQLNYPFLPSRDYLENKFGRRISEHFRYLENINSPETLMFIDQQKKFLSRYLSHMFESRKLFALKYSELYQAEKIMCPQQHGRLYFYFKKSTNQSPYILYNSDVADQIGDVLLDPTKVCVAKGSTIEDIWISEDGQVLCYGISTANSLAMTVHVKYTNNPDEKADILYCHRNTSIVWTADNEGFYYTLYHNTFLSTFSTIFSNNHHDNNIEYPKIMYHQLGTKQRYDILLYEGDAGVSLGYHLQLSSNHNKLLITIKDKYEHKNLFHYIDISQFNRIDKATVGSCIRLIDSLEYEFEYIACYEQYVWFRTNYEADNYHIIRLEYPSSPPLTSISHSLVIVPNQSVWRDNYTIVVSELKDANLTHTAVTASSVVLLKYVRGMTHELHYVDLYYPSYGTSISGGTPTLHVASTSVPQLQPSKLFTASLGTIEGPMTSPTSSQAFFQYFSLANPGTIYIIVMGRGGDGKVEGKIDPLVKKSPNTSDVQELESKFVSCKSKDGTTIPMCLFGGDNLQSHLNSESSTNYSSAKSKPKPQLPARPPPIPCLLYVDGGFGLASTPSYSLARYLFVRHFQAMFCMVGVRGGGELGKMWHLAGRRHRKQRSVEDIIAAAEYLIKQGYTTSSQLAIQGGGHGGLLVAACVNQRPDLFSAVLLQSGIYDMVRYHRSGGGEYWLSEFGCADGSREDLDQLLSLSPLHNVGQSLSPYPAVLVCTGEFMDKACIDSHIHG